MKLNKDLKKKRSRNNSKKTSSHRQASGRVRLGSYRTLPFRLSLGENRGSSIGFYKSTSIHRICLKFGTHPGDSARIVCAVRNSSTINGIHLKLAIYQFVLWLIMQAATFSTKYSLRKYSIKKKVFHILRRRCRETLTLRLQFSAIF